jgi:hypothetical protein
MLRLVGRLIRLGVKAGGDKDVEKVGERLQGVGISTADGSSSTGLHELLTFLSVPSFWG